MDLISDELVKLGICSWVAIILGHPVSLLKLRLWHCLLSADVSISFCAYSHLESRWDQETCSTSRSVVVSVSL